MNKMKTKTRNWRSFLKSEAIYWLLVIFSLIAFLVVLWFILIPNGVIEPDLGLNLFSEIIGILFTIIFLTWLFQFRERRRWASVEKSFKQKLSLLMLDLFTKLHFALDPRLIQGSIDAEDLNRLANLEHIELNILVRLAWSKLSIESSKKNESTTENVTYEVEKIRKYYSRLADKIIALESTYVGFCDANLRSSLIKIEQRLENINDWLDVGTIIVERIGEKEFSKKRAEMIHEIIKEINWMYENGYIEWK